MGSVPNNETSYPVPLKSTGALDKFEFADATPSIGREYPKVNIVDDLLNAPNADELVRELGIASTSHHDQSKHIRNWLTLPFSFFFLSRPARCCLLPQTGQPNQRSSEAAHPAPW